MAFREISPGALLSPVPAVMVSCAAEGVRPNIITIAWAGTVCSQPPMLSISVRKERFSHRILTDSGEFVVNLVGRDQMKAMDYCGVRSGRDEDKFATCGLTTQPVEQMRYAPAIAECPVYLACKTEHKEELMDASGNIDVQKAGLVAYCHGIYHGLGEALGFFGFSVAAPKVYARRMKALKQK